MSVFSQFSYKKFFLLIRLELWETKKPTKTKIWWTQLKWFARKIQII
ncbi:MAG: hypothetical protein MRECE_22c016 [Mycoplasmataceae bacterium CE_OT135]|nr:MAG: hypothetical protein MRECE_22c016 [Mycoplasmataceae bacterium CE_OT135]